MPRLLTLLAVIEVALAIAAMISCLSAERHELRLPRLAWVVIILLFPLVGSIAWFVAGREPRPGDGAIRTGPPQRPTAPDDDPDFLRSLRKRREQDEKDH